MSFAVKHLAGRSSHYLGALSYVTLKCGDCDRGLDELYASCPDDEPRLMSSWYDRPGPPNPPSRSVTRRLVPPPGVSPDLSLPDGLRQLKFLHDLRLRYIAAYRCHPNCGAGYVVGVEQLTRALLARPQGTKRVSTYDLGLIPVGRRRHRLKADT